MTPASPTPAQPAPAENRRKSAAGIALRVAGALPALLAGLMVIGIIGSMAQGNLGARDAVVDVILLVGLPGALAAGLFRWAGRLDQRAADRPASAAAVFAPRIRPVPQVTRAPVPRVEPVRAPVLNPPPVGAGGGAPVSVPSPAAIPAAADSAEDPPQAGPATVPADTASSSAVDASKPSWVQRVAETTANARERGAKAAITVRGRAGEAVTASRKRLAEGRERRDQKRTTRRAAAKARREERRRAHKDARGAQPGEATPSPAPRRGAIMDLAADIQVPGRSWVRGGRVSLYVMPKHQQSIRDLTRTGLFVRHGKGGSGALAILADVIPEPRNRVDSRAVQIWVRGKAVAYFSEEWKEIAHQHIAANGGKRMRVPVVLRWRYREGQSVWACPSLADAEAFAAWLHREDLRG